MKRTRAVVLFLAVAVITLLAWPVLAQAETTDLVSVSSDGTQGDNGSQAASISADGSSVAFASTATNLVSTDPDDMMDVFIRNLVTGTTDLVSVSSDGTKANAACGSPSVNADGTVVTFTSTATNLVAGIDWGLSFQNVFVRNLLTGTTELVSVSSDGTAAANGFCTQPSVSADGTSVAFASQATNLVAADTNATQDVFVRDLPSGTTELVSVSSDGTQGNGFSDTPSINADGTVVAFTSDAGNLAAADTDTGLYDVFVRDRKAGTTELVSVDGGGIGTNTMNVDPSINADGTVVAFVSMGLPTAAGVISLSNVATVLGPQVYLRDRGAGTTELVSMSGGGIGTDNWSFSPSINADGSIVAFVSAEPSSSFGLSGLVSLSASAEVLPTSNVFVRDRKAAVTELLSVGWDGNASNGFCDFPSISADGSLVAFDSDATNLVQGDANGAMDIFLASYTRQLKSGYPVRYEQNNSNILFKGEWSQGSSKSYSGGSLLYSNDPEASITITFKGTRLDWIAAVGPLMGKALVSIDGGEPVLVDLYNQVELFRQLVWSTGDLEYGVHVITITFPTDQDEVKPINIDALDLWGILLKTTES